MALSISTDFDDLADNVEAVTITLVRPGGNATVAITKALRRALSRRDTGVGGVQLSGENTVWNFSDASLNPASQNRIVQADDLIASSSQPAATWAVLTAELQTLSSRWRCTCRKVR